MDVARLFVLLLILTTALCNHTTITRCARTRTGRLVCNRVAVAHRTATGTPTSSRRSPSGTQNRGFLGRFSGGFGPNARVGRGLFASDRFLQSSFGGGGGGSSAPRGNLLNNNLFFRRQFGRGPFRSIPNGPLASWSRLPFGFI